MLLCLEEGSRHSGLAGVVGEVARLSMTASRRLQLAAETSGVIAFVIRRWRTAEEAGDFAQPTAAAKARCGRWKPAMRRVVSLFLPTWPTDRLRRRKGDGAPAPAEPLVLADGLVIDVTGAAHLFGGGAALLRDLLRA